MMSSLEKEQYDVLYSMIIVPKDILNIIFDYFRNKYNYKLNTVSDIKKVNCIIGQCDNIIYIRNISNAVDNGIYEYNLLTTKLNKIIIEPGFNYIDHLNIARIDTYKNKLYVLWQNKKILIKSNDNITSHKMKYYMEDIMICNSILYVLKKNYIVMLDLDNNLTHINKFKIEFNPQSYSMRFHKYETDIYLYNDRNTYDDVMYKINGTYVEKIRMKMTIRNYNYIHRYITNDIYLVIYCDNLHNILLSIFDNYDFSKLCELSIDVNLKYNRIDGVIFYDKYLYLINFDKIITLFQVPGVV